MIPWESLWHVGWVVLGLALAFGVYRYHTRNKANDKVTEKATRELYKHPDSYDEGTRQELKKELRPN